MRKHLIGTWGNVEFFIQLLNYLIELIKSIVPKEREEPEFCSDNVDRDLKFGASSIHTHWFVYQNRDTNEYQHGDKEIQDTKLSLKSKNLVEIINFLTKEAEDKCNDTYGEKHAWAGIRIWRHGRLISGPYPLTFGYDYNSKASRGKRTAISYSFG